MSGLDTSGSRVAIVESPLPRRAALVLLGLGLGVMYLPTLYDLYLTFWRTEDQGHGPVILGVACWLMWRRWKDIDALHTRGHRGAAFALLLVSLLCYVVGRSQAIIQMEVGSLIPTLAALMLLWRGVAGLRMIAFALFFLIFMIPLPGVFVQMLTVPLKSAVSYVAEVLMYHVGYPIARTGVILQVGPYQLLVADACSGLNSMFTLESLGLLYLNIMGYSSALRNTLLALLIIPISFFSNVVRVIILVLVTYYFGDEAGQGFVHGFAGMVLFTVALVCMLSVDRLLGKFVLRGKHE